MARWPLATCRSFPIVLCALVGCADRSVERGRDAGAARRVELPATNDPAVLYDAMRAASRGGCDQLAAALESLGARAVEGRRRIPHDVLSGLVVDACRAARQSCTPADARARLASARGPAVALARVHLLDGDPEARLALLAHAADDVAAIRFRRAELLERLGRIDEAIRELERGLALEDDPDARVEIARIEIARGSPDKALFWLRASRGSMPQPIALARVAALAAAGRDAEVVSELEQAELPFRRDIAFAAADATTDPERLANAGAGYPELLEALGDRLAMERRPGVAAGLFAQAAALAPRDENVVEKLADSLAAAGEVEAALAAWNRAAALAPEARRPQLEPIALLARAGRRTEAVRRAGEVARAARQRGDADELAIASDVAVSAGARELALALAREALAARPGDGQLALQVAGCLEQARQPTEALEALARLFVCGAHGRPWHRHDLARRLAALARSSGQVQTLETLLRTRPDGCAPPAPEELASMTSAIIASLRL